LAVRNTPRSLAISAAAAHNASGIGSRPVWEFRRVVDDPSGAGTRHFSGSGVMGKLASKRAFRLARY
jgi:hypothetical protein